jgi:hypothetical protein
MYSPNSPTDIRVDALERKLEEMEDRLFRRRKGVPFDMTSYFTFGRYNGRQARDVASFVDPPYILWVAENVRWLNVSDKLYNTAKQNANRRINKTY